MQSTRFVVVLRFLAFLLLGLVKSSYSTQGEASVDAFREVATLSEAERKLRGPSSASSIVCDVYLLDASLEHPDGSMYGTEGYVCEEIESDEDASSSSARGGMLYDIELSSTFLEQHRKDIVEGSLRIRMKGARIRHGRVHGVPHDKHIQVLKSYDEDDDEQHNRRQLSASPAMGRITVSILRVSTQDAEPIASADRLQDVFFNHDPSLRSQYSACSFGALNLQPTDNAQHRVVDITVADSIDSFPSPKDLVNTATRQFEATYGFHASTIADKVYYVLPKGNGDLMAAATLNGWRAWATDLWALSLSALMHETGHLFGLTHSNKDGVPYEDRTGYMTYAKKSSVAPLKCFNGHKNYQLGWYSDKTETIDPYRNPPRLISLAPFVDYDKIGSDTVVLIDISNVLFVQYNRAKGFNLGTEDMQNLVTVTEYHSEGSDLLAGLGLQSNVVPSTYRRGNFLESGKTLVLELCRHTEDDVLVISVGMDESLCSTLPNENNNEPRTSPPPGEPPSEPRFKILQPPPSLSSEPPKPRDRTQGDSIAAKLVAAAVLHRNNNSEGNDGG